LSGSTGLIGSVDGVHVLEKDKRTSNKAKLTIANRDTEGFCFRLEFEPDNCKWLFIGNESDSYETDDSFCILIFEFMKEQDTWTGTATELCDELNQINTDYVVNHLSITKKLNTNADTLKSKYHVDVDTDKRTQKKRVILISKSE
jgi:hypothetical protein